METAACPAVTFMCVYVPFVLICSKSPTEAVGFYASYDRGLVKVQHFSKFVLIEKFHSS